MPNPFDPLQPPYNLEGKLSEAYNNLVKVNGIVGTESDLIEFLLNIIGDGNGGTGHPAASITNNESSFSWNAATQVGNIPTASVTNNGDNTVTIDAGDGTASVTINLSEIDKGSGAPSGTPTGQDPIIYIDTDNGNIYTWDGDSWEH